MPAILQRQCLALHARLTHGVLRVDDHAVTVTGHHAEIDVWVRRATPREARIVSIRASLERSHSASTSVRSSTISSRYRSRSSRSRSTPSWMPVAELSTCTVPLQK